VAIFLFSLRRKQKDMKTLTLPMKAFSRSCTLVFFVLVFICSAKAQVKGDTLVIYRPEKFNRFVLNLDNRTSLLNGKIFSLIGLKAGISIHHRWRLGTSYHQLLVPTEVSYSNRGLNYTRKLSLWYGGVFVEWVILHRKQYEISMPLSYGLGHLQSIPLNHTQSTSTAFTEVMQVAELTLSGYFKLANWMGPGFGFGYRALLSDNSQPNN
jgi:hypothetical protein